MEQRIDRIERAIQEMIETRKSDRLLLERHDKILANLEANQIIMGKVMESMKDDMSSMKEDVSKFIHAVSTFMDTVGYKFRDYDDRLKKLEDK